MFSIDCSRCPIGPRDCGDCMISALLGEESQVTPGAEESCGYVLAPEMRSAIEVLLGAGLVSRVEILAVETAA